MRYSELCISPEKSICQAMRQLDSTAKRIVFVVENGKLIATLTDGDVRRHLLNGGRMEDPVTAAANSRPQMAECYEDAKMLLKTSKTALIAVPVVSKDGELQDIVMQNTERPDGLPKLDIPVVIQAGGKGSRLDPYTRVLPKPLIPVGNLPIVEHIMERFCSYGCNTFHLIVNHKKQLIKAYFNEIEKNYNITWYDEDKPLDTGGGLSLLKGKVKSTFFLSNCDILLRSDYESILRFHRGSGSVITMVAARKKMTLPYGVIDVDESGVVEAIREKPEMTFLTNTGMYLIEPEVLEDIQENVPIKFTDIMEMQRKKGRKVAAFCVDENEWLDMGQFEELKRMEEKLGLQQGYSL